MDIFAEHAIAGMVGLVFNGLFGSAHVIGLDGVNSGSTTYLGGWYSHHYRQLYVQVAYICAASSYAFVMSAMLAYLIDIVPGLRLRASEDAELMGMDEDQLGEFAYDYVEVRRDYLAWTPAHHGAHAEEASVPAEQQHGISEHSNMIEGKEPSEPSSDQGNEHTAVAGDRHAMAAEKPGPRS